MSEETVTFNLEINLEPTYAEIKKFETVLMRSLSLLRRMTGSKDVATAINAIQRLITIIRMLQVTMLAFQAATGPLGWAYLTVTAISTGFYALDPMLEMNAR